ncbi:MAG: glycosyltransferase family 87 protein [Sphingomicrobium sp.]
MLASGEWLNRERVTIVAATSAAIGAAMLAYLFATAHHGVDRFGQPIGTDFSVFWNAGYLANQGRAADAWNPEILNATAHVTHGANVGDSAWLYPPPFLFVASPLAALPYVLALVLWQLFSLAIIAVALSAILRSRRAVLVALASPIVPTVLGHGQNALLTASLLSGGLLLLRRSPALAGSAVGALVYKPQLGLLIGPLLLVTRSWLALLAAALVASALIAGSLLFWGIESWHAFVASLKFGRLFMEQGSVGFHKSASLFAMARQWGASVRLGYAVQVVGLATAFWLIWRLRNSEPAIRAAGVCAAVALSTPYFLDYEMAVVGVGAAFLYAHGQATGFRPYERSLLALIWIAPWFSRPAAEYLAAPVSQIAVIGLAVLIALRASPSRHSRATSAP